MARVMMAINSAWNVANFRAGLVRSLIDAGHEVVAVVVDDGAVARVQALGARVIAIPMANRSASIGKDAGLFARFLALMRREHPDVYLGWTIKPNTYGSLAAAISGVPAINNISGLGTAFIRTSWLTYVARGLYTLGLRRSSTVFFQNADDRDLFERLKLVRADQTELLPGSGIDPVRFAPGIFPHPADGRFRFLMVARMLRDKGAYEYVEAARRVKARHPKAVFQVLGFLDVENRTAVPRDEFERWVADGTIEYLGAAEDVRPHLAAADCVVLPSYREGTSRVLLEAAAMGRPAITTDVPGCRDVVVDGETGLLCRVRDAEDLADAMSAMIEAGNDRRAGFAAAARQRALDHFAEATVIARYHQAIGRAMRGARAPSQSRKS